MIPLTTSLSVYNRLAASTLASGIFVSAASAVHKSFRSVHSRTPRYPDSNRSQTTRRESRSVARPSKLHLLPLVSVMAFAPSLHIRFDSGQLGRVLSFLWDCYMALTGEGIANRPSCRIGIWDPIHPRCALSSNNSQSPIRHQFEKYLPSPLRPAFTIPTTSS